MIFPWFIVSFDISQTLAPIKMAPVDIFFISYWIKTLILWVDHPWILQAVWYPFRTMLCNFLFYPLPMGFSGYSSLILSHTTLLASLGKFSPTWKYSANQQPEIYVAPKQCSYSHSEGGNNMMGLGWDPIQKSGIEVLESEVPVVWIGKTWEIVDTLIIPYVDVSNQPLLQSIRGANNIKFSLNEVGFGLVSGQVCDEAFPYITPKAVRGIEFGGDSNLLYHKNILNECPSIDLH